MNTKNDKQANHTSEMNPNIVFFSFIGDALSLGPHWVYDQDEIQTKLGRVTSYHAPITNYHPGKTAGDFTHYGDQTRVLLRSLVSENGFDRQTFAAQWRAFWEDVTNKTYRDGATRQTLEHLQAGTPPDRAGSDSHDIAGAGRNGPLFLLTWKDDDALITAIRRQTAFTHATDEVIGAAEFFGHVVLAVRAGHSIPDALASAWALKTWRALPESWLDAARESAASTETDSASLKNHGLNCHTDNAFPCICHLLLRYPTDPVSALIENATAGGDSAARGMILGLVYGAKYPIRTLPEEWLSGLNARDEISTLISHFASLHSS